MPIISALGRQNQENHEFKVCLGCIARPCLRERERKKEKEREREREREFQLKL
jgi:hypothetical protein